MEAAEVAEPLLPPWEELLTSPPRKGVQSALQKLMDNQTWNNLVNEHKEAADPDSLRVCGLLMSGCGPGARAWARTIPSAPAIQLSPNELVDAVGLALCQGDPRAALVRICVCGKDIRNDRYGDHVRCCDAQGKFLLSHNALRNVFMRIAREAGFRPTLDDRLMGALADEPEGKGQGDFVIQDGLDGLVLLADVRRTHPAQANPTPARRTAAEVGGYVREVETYKRSHLHSLVEQAIHAGKLDADLRNRIQIAPLIVDSYGCWGQDTLDFLTKCASKFPPDVKSLKISYWHTLLSVALQRENSRLLRVRVADSIGHSNDRTAPSEAWWGAGVLKY